METQSLEQFASSFGFKDSNDWVMHALFYGSNEDFVRLQTTTEYHLLAQNRYKLLVDQIFENNNIANQAAFVKLIEILAQNISNTTHIRQLARSLKLNTHTIQRYLKLLEDNGVIFGIKGYRNRRKDELHIYAKYYFVEQSVLTYVLKVHKTDRLTMALANSLWHNLCISQKYQACIEGIKCGKITLHYWQTHDKLHYDLVIHDRGHRKTTAYNLDFRTNSLARKAPIGYFPIKSIIPLSLWGKTYPKHRTFQITTHSILTFLK